MLGLINLASARALGFYCRLLLAPLPDIAIPLRASKHVSPSSDRLPFFHPSRALPSVEVRRGLVIPLAEPLPVPILALLQDFRRLVNEAIREALTTGKTAKGSLSRFALLRARALGLNSLHALTGAEIARALAKAHRRRLRQDLGARVPYVRQPFLRTVPNCFHLDLDRSRVRLSLRKGEWSSFPIQLAKYHREVLATPGLRVKQLHLTPDRMVVLFAKPAPDPYPPTALLAFDTNEGSLDGVEATPNGNRLVRVPFPEIPLIQARHFTRRRHLAQKKSHDRRVARRLLGGEGRRERHRVRSRLHDLTRRLVEAAVHHHAALALEDLSGLLRTQRRASRKLRRRLSSWPRHELHRQIEYKAADRGVPVYWVNPYRTSKTCPRCGEVSSHRSRVGPVFTCAACGWSMDRQLNPGVNVGRTVLREAAELGGLRLDLDALLEDARSPRYPFDYVGRAREERRGREGRKFVEGGSAPP